MFAPVDARAQDIGGDAGLPGGVGVDGGGASIGEVDDEVEPHPLRRAPGGVIVAPVRAVARRELHAHDIRSRREQTGDVDAVVADFVEVLAPSGREERLVGANPVQVEPVGAKPADCRHRARDGLAAEVEAFSEAV